MSEALEKLDIGCGSRKDPSYIGLDHKPFPGVDVVFDLNSGEPWPLEDGRFEYIMARGRWKNVESVVRYVETPLDIKITDSRDMTLQRDAPPGRPTSVWGGTHYPEVGRPRNTSVRGGGSKVRIVK